MNLIEFTAEDTTLVEQCAALQTAVDVADAPWVHPTPPERFASYLAHGWDGELPRAFAAVESGRVVALAELFLGEWDNLHLAWVDLSVHPDARRRGIGTAAFTELEGLARSLGRTSLGTDGWEGAAPARFAVRHGLELKSQAINRRQRLDRLDRAQLRKLYDEALEAAGDYDLVRLVGPTPDDLIEMVADLSAAINDAPTDDLDVEDEVFPVERVRNYEEANRAKGDRQYRLLARHRATGEPAGHTVVAVESARPAIGHQHDTSVVRGHRGHRLGMLLKTAMNLWLDEVEPDLRTIDTWNTESNDYMISVNEQLGYEWLGRRLEFQKAL